MKFNIIEKECNFDMKSENLLLAYLRWFAFILVRNIHKKILIYIRISSFFMRFENRYHQKLEKEQAKVNTILTAKRKWKRCLRMKENITFLKKKKIVFFFTKEKKGFFFYGGGVAFKKLHVFNWKKEWVWISFCFSTPIYIGWVLWLEQ